MLCSSFCRPTVAQAVRVHTSAAAQNLSRRITAQQSPLFTIAYSKSIQGDSAWSYFQAMGKKKSKGEYNDFLDGEKLRDNADIRTSLQSSSSVTRHPLPPPSQQHDRRGGKRTGEGKKGPSRPPLTHFLCLPLVTGESEPQLLHGLEKLKGELRTKDIVPLKAVRPLGTLHLTIGVMSIEEAKVQELQQYLQDLDLYSIFRDISLQRIAEQAAKDGVIGENFNAAAMPKAEPLKINLESLVPMQSPTNTSILYAEPRDASRRLYAFASELRKRFTADNYMVEDTRPLKLHATIINTIYAKPGGRRRKSGNTKATAEHNDNGISLGGPNAGGSANDDVDTSLPEGQQMEAKSGHGPNAKSWMRFDASSLITTFSDFRWAEGIQIDKVHICKMGAKKIWSGGREGEGEIVDEEYEVVASKNILG